MSASNEGKRDFFVIPVFHKALKDLSTSQGECLVLECRLKGVPPPVVTWKREDDAIDDCPDFRILHRGEVATLVIGEAFPEDSGIFTCEATNKAGKATTSCRITVKGGGYHTISTKSAAAPQSYQHNRPVQVLPTRGKSDDSNNFKVEKDQVVQDIARAISSPTEKSTKQENKSQGDYILYSPTLAAVLEIEPQEYKVSNFEQRLINEIEYRLERTPPVNEDPEDCNFEDVPTQQQRGPLFTTTLKNFKAMDGTSAKFSCHVTANPPAKMFWFKDGKQISKRSQHYIHKQDGEGGHELHITHLSAEDDGNYTALATNPQSRVSSSGMLAVESERGHVMNDTVAPARSYRSRVPPQKGELAKDEESPVEKYYRPTFIQKPSADTKVDEGKLVRFNVKVTGLPIPVIEWLINGRPIRQDPLHKILVRENNVHSLLLDRASPMDEGQYTIVATNKAGTATVHVQLHVTPREFTTAPAFVQRLAPQCVAEGEAVRLEARVVGTPKPLITWKRGSDQVTHDHRTQLYQDESGYVCLQITQANLQDTAWYTCSANNKAGISSCNCKLDVYSPTCDVATSRRRIRTPHRYANLAKVAGVDMREALTPDAQVHHYLPESDDL